MLLPQIDHTSPSFIMAYQMDGDICDKIIEDFEYRENNSFFDKVRGYHRLQNGQMDSDLMDEYMRLPLFPVSSDLRQRIEKETDKILDLM